MASALASEYVYAYKVEDYPKLHILSFLYRVTNLDVSDTNISTSLSS